MKGTGKEGRQRERAGLLPIVHTTGVDWNTDGQYKMNQNIQMYFIELNKFKEGELTLDNYAKKILLI